MRENDTGRLLAANGVCLVVQPDVIKEFGRAEALVLQQLHYWLSSAREDIGVVREGKRWVYNTYEDWANNIKAYSARTIRRAIARLEKAGIVSSSNLNKSKYDHTKWYTINYDALEAFAFFTPTDTKSANKDAETDPNENSSLNDQPDMAKMAEQDGQNGLSINRNTESIHIKSYKSSISLKENKDNGVYQKGQNSKKASTDHLPQKMLEIWNQVIEQGKNIRTLTKKRARFLVQAFKNKFDSSLDKWKAFCEHIAKSKFLMGMKGAFKASIDWVLKFEVIQRIMEGDYEIGSPLTFSSSAQATVQGIEASITEINEPEAAKDFRLNILHRLGSASYIGWFKHVQLCVENSKLVIYAPNRFHKEYIDTHFGFLIESIIRDHSDLDIAEITVDLEYARRKTQNSSLSE